MYQQPFRSGGYQPPQFAASGVSVQALLGRVLGIVAGGFVFTGVAAYLTAAFALPRGASLIALFAGFGFILAINLTRRNEPLSLLLFYAFTACEGIGLGPTIASYAQGENGSAIVVQAAATTALGMGILAAIVYMTSFDYRKLSGIGFALLLVLVVVGLISAFTHFLHPQVYAWATLFVFTILTLVDFARVRAADGSASAVQLATSIYLDALNIFLALLRIFGRNR